MPSRLVHDERARLCHTCQTPVYNLAALSPDEAYDLITKSEKVPCVKMYRRVDGKFMMKDCPRAIKKMWSTKKSILAFLLLALVYLISTAIKFIGPLDDKVMGKPSTLTEEPLE